MKRILADGVTATTAKGSGVWEFRDAQGVLLGAATKVDWGWQRGTWFRAGSAGAIVDNLGLTMKEVAARLLSAHVAKSEPEPSPETLPADALTLYPMDFAERGLFHPWDDNRDIVTLLNGRPAELTCDWQTLAAVGALGQPVTVQIRRANCGGECMCGGEYRVIRHLTQVNS